MHLIIEPPPLCGTVHPSTGWQSTFTLKKCGLERGDNLHPDCIKLAQHWTLEYIIKPLNAETLIPLNQIPSGAKRCTRHFFDKKLYTVELLMSRNPDLSWGEKNPWLSNRQDSVTVIKLEYIGGKYLNYIVKHLVFFSVIAKMCQSNSLHCYCT